MKYCFLDLETTGFEPAKDSIIECSFLLIEDGKEVERYDQVFQPDKSPLNEFVANLTGISQTELDKEGLIFKHEAQKISDLISDCPIIGHNIDFDINFLIGNGVEVENNPRIDTHELARIVLPLETSYALEVLTQKYGFIHENAHRAMSDVEGCEKFFNFLVEKINALPQSFLADVKPFLQSKTDWAARELFINTPGIQTSKRAPADDNSQAAAKTPLLDQIEKQSVNIKFHPHLTESITATLNAQDTPVVLVTPRVKNFDHLEKFPTPEVILDATKLEAFKDNRDKLDDQATTFYLKLKYRLHLGYRGLFFCDLFFKERDYWNEVHTNEDSPLFEEVLSKKAQFNILVASPEAYFRFIKHPIFTSRSVVLDEAEQAAKALLFTPTKTFSLHPFLNHFDAEIATKTQFIVSRICREFIEKKLGYEIGHFPQKMCLDHHDDIKHFVEALSEVVDQAEWDFWKNVLAQAPAQSVRWLNYHPDSGNLSFGYWHPEPWRELKDQLCQRKICLLRRSEGADSDQFFNIFTGIKALDPAETKTPPNRPRLIIPQDLVSPKSPDFNEFTVQKILECYHKNEGNIAVNFSSLDSLRTVFDQLKSTLKDEDCFIIGEKVNGGAGKIMEMLKNQNKNRIIFFYQRLDHPDLKQWDFPTLLIQKFPFAPPEPLLDKFKQTMQQSGQSFWDIWILNHMQADISRRIDVLNGVEQVFFIDSRENAAWGKKTLKSVFG